MSSEVEFDEDKYKAASQMYSRGESGSKMANWLMKHGLAKSPAMAQWVLLAFVAVMVALAFLIYRAF